jgi:hypothetical protein
MRGKGAIAILEPFSASDTPFADHDLHEETDNPIIEKQRSP